MKSFQQSEIFFKKVEKIIPLGSQTFSKSALHFPQGVSPLFLTKGKGSHVWDIDGNEYIDFSSSLAAITLGYQDPDVDSAVQMQMQNGVSFSLPHPLEYQVAGKIIEMVPCAEMVRFGKNGSDATAGAIRLARAYTRRDHVLVGGYHGWQDWYIGSTSRDLGVPDAVKSLTHKFIYNDIDSVLNWFSQYPNEIAAVILEPMSGDGPKSNFLENLQEICKKNSSVLIFDEVVTGFRMHNGGAQAYFGVTPDLCALGKGLANGYPLSAVAGKAEIMRLMEEIFFSFTFGGETLSLAASLATLNKLQTHNVISTLTDRGTILLANVRALIEKHGLTNFLGIRGHSTHSVFEIKKTLDYSEFEIRTFFLQECAERGILTLGAHNLSYAHSQQDIEKIISAYDDIFAFLAATIEKKALKDHTRGKILTPLFAVR